MDKEAFLTELRVSLHVLNENELTDIIEEYEQHIDLKVQKGLSEEQAIADFGNIKDLINGIMDAYHLRIDEAAEGSRIDSNKSQPDSDSEWESTNERIFETSTERLKKYLPIVERFKSLITWMKDGMKWIWGHIVLFFGWIKTGLRFRSVDNAEKEVKTRVKVKRSSMEKEQNCTNAADTGIKSFGSKWKKGCTVKLKSIGRCFGAFVNWTLNIMTFWIRVFWNSMLVCIAGTIGILGLVTVYISGICSVLVFQGYPIAGITIGCFGMVLSLFSCMAFVWSFYWRKPQKNYCGEMDNGMNCETINELDREMEMKRNMEMEEHVNA